MATQEISQEHAVERMCEILERLRNDADEPPAGGDDVLATLVQTILSQSTTNLNSERAFESLVTTFEGDWQAVAEAEEADVRAAIRCGGLARQKAPRIQAILQGTRERYGAYSLESLREETAAEAVAILSGFPGVGPKTAAFVAMWALGADVFPMDTHIFRILTRVGLLDASLSDKRAHAAMEALVPEGTRFVAHMALVRHGREICHARAPNCEGCVIRSLCDFAQER
ncbi:MAG: endonuclease III [bacterium]